MNNHSDKNIRIVDMIFFCENALKNDSDSKQIIDDMLNHKTTEQLKQLFIKAENRLSIINPDAAFVVRGTIKDCF